MRLVKKRVSIPKCCYDHVSTQRLMGDSSCSSLCGFPNSTNVYEHDQGVGSKGRMAGWGKTHQETLCVYVCVSPPFSKTENV